MKFLLNIYTTTFLIASAFSTAAFAQTNKVKTITIVNGDTTISEKEMGANKLSEVEKEITITGDADSKSGKKKIVKKVIIKSDKDPEADAVAYAYSTNNEDDMEITTNDDGKETRIIIKKSDGKKDKNKEETTVVRKSARSAEEKNVKENMSLNLNIENNIAKLEIETGSKKPLNVSVLDENGKQVFYDSKKEGGSYSKEIKIEKGIYFLSIIQNKKTTNEKIVID